MPGLQGYRFIEEILIALDIYLVGSESQACVVSILYLCGKNWTEIRGKAYGDTLKETLGVPY